MFEREVKEQFEWHVYINLAPTRQRYLFHSSVTLLKDGSARMFIFKSTESIKEQIIAYMILIALEMWVHWIMAMRSRFLGKGIQSMLLFIWLLCLVLWRNPKVDINFLFALLFSD
jgi:hypothetical protein